MTKLTKTQQYLIEQAKKCDGYTVECISGRGAFGGKIKTGDRQRNALNKLVDQGLAVIVSRITDVDHNRGNAIWCTSIRYRLTIS